MNQPQIKSNSTIIEDIRMDGIEKNRDADLNVPTPVCQKMLSKFVENTAQCTPYLQHK